LHKAGFHVDLARSAADAQPSLDGELDLILLDLEVADVDGVDLVRKLVKRTPAIPVVVLATPAQQSRIIAAIRSGAAGCLFLEDLDERLLAAIKEALAGGRPMSRGLGPLLMEHVRQMGRHSSHQRKMAKPITEREQQVLEQMARGFSYEDIGKMLGVSLNTVRSHVRTIYEKFEVNSRTEAVLLAIKLGVVKRTPFPSLLPRS